jgi:hypothetical protein
MPNPKVGTVTPDVATAVRNAKAGQVQYRADKAGIVQCPIGRASFTTDALRQNLVALVDALNKARPSGAKGVYLRKIAVSSTMGPGVRVDVAVEASPSGGGSARGRWLWAVAAPARAAAGCQRPQAPLAGLNRRATCRRAGADGVSQCEESRIARGKRAGRTPERKDAVGAVRGERRPGGV